MTRRRGQTALAGGGPGGGTRTNGQAEALAFPQASPPACRDHRTARRPAAVGAYDRCRDRAAARGARPPVVASQGEHRGSPSAPGRGWNSGDDAQARTRRGAALEARN